MTTLLAEPPVFLRPATEESMVYVPSRPITFPEFLELFNEKIELVSPDDRPSDFIGLETEPRPTIRPVLEAIGKG